MTKVIIVFGIVLVLFGALASCGPGIPKRINEVIFEKSQFSIPITLKLPSEDDPKYIEKLKMRFIH